MNSPAMPNTSPNPARMRSRGFTLIEVMIVVAIVGLLSAIAIPSYTSYLRRGDLNEGFANLSQYRVAMEQYYQDNRAYGTGTACGATVPTSGNFTYTCATSNGNQSYLLTATGATGKRTDGYNYTITESNVKATTKFASSAVTKSCWLIKSTSEC